MQIADLRECFDEANQDDLPDHSFSVYSGNSPMLLEGLTPPSDMDTILRDLPQKNICDRLVFKYFNSVEAITGQ
jgi:hypothetical protein